MNTRAFGKLLAIAGAIAVVTAVCVSIYLDPPSTVKARTLDRQRMQGLQQVDIAIRAYYRSNHALPDRLDVIENRNGLSAQSNWRDPVTHLSYEYDVMSKTTYRLCADFSADSERDQAPYVVAFRNHHKGHDCFQQEVNAE